jgi:hypothetical protein
LGIGAGGSRVKRPAHLTADQLVAGMDLEIAVHASHSAWIGLLICEGVELKRIEATDMDDAFQLCVREYDREVDRRIALRDEEARLDDSYLRRPVGSGWLNR